MLEHETFELVVQVNGRVRDRVEVPVDLPDEELVARAKELPRVRAHLDGKEIRKTIVVPGRLRQPGRIGRPILGGMAVLDLLLLLVVLLFGDAGIRARAGVAGCLRSAVSRSARS